MQIRTRKCMSADGHVATPDGLPVQLADPAFVPGESYGFPEFQKSCDAVLMGRTTSGAPRTIETFRALGALDKLGLIVLPILLGAGMRLTPALSPEAELTLESDRPLPGRSVEVVYAC